MTETWRDILYPLGYLSAVAFAGRFILQWIASERSKRCVVIRSFWHLSLAGNIMLWLHSVIQFQLHVALVQAANAIISWRNLNLMAPQHKQHSLKIVWGLMACSITLTSLFFIVQDWHPSLEQIQIEYGWHFLGTLGIILFALRFWVQWWQSESLHKSVFSPTFWWISIIGAALSLIYFVRIEDPVNIIGPAAALLPYLRNLFLSRKEIPMVNIKQNNL